MHYGVGAEAISKIYFNSLKKRCGYRAGMLVSCMAAYGFTNLDFRSNGELMFVLVAQMFQAHPLLYPCSPHTGAMDFVIHM